ncbi:SusC/RagA family TonB-linked outer membrane protein [Flavobacterium defluvii]|uniref:TonB-linked outer membrane protein, SusC/RagA family n=1 Tax=Flavobacterium defluvii TaxID=370979 RepID=A0A1M5JDK3_9FLAO|nr:SusC/RagA family TonB-linked outer membrane protein [Flavobacterium defluvii]SHG38369.1 TonB-linked outer membrane protein, SusC/RagA family [Flavobacterium defluvii]
MNIFSFFKGGKAFYCLLFTGFLLSFSPSAARNSLRRSTSSFQQHLVQGTVSDGTSPLPGVTISLKGNSKAAVISDYNGQFSISAGLLDTLVVSYLGFKTNYIPIKSRTKIDIVLQYDTTTLQEVKVNAGYYSVKESERTGSIARITSKDIETQPVTNVLATMQGRMAGVSITQTTGVPGGGFDIKIRGQNSIRSDANAPLYIIDGVPYSSDPIGSYYTGTTFPGLVSPLNNINTESIESIEVLKDADATAIYGSRGANGVVLITTKKGKKGKTTYSFSTSTGAGKVTRFLKLMNTTEYLGVRRQAFINDGLTQYGASDYDVNGTWDQNRYTNWQKELLGGTSQISDFQGSVTGGSETTQFLLSGNFHRETTVFPAEFVYKKGGSQFSLNHRSADTKFKLIFSASYNIQDNDQPSFDLTNDARTLPPNAPALYDSNGNLNWENGTWDNPLANLESKLESSTNDFLSNVMLSYEIANGLVLKSSFGFTNLSTKETRIVPSTMGNPMYNPSSSSSGIFSNNTDRKSWIIEPQITWTFQSGRSRYEFLAGSTFQNQNTTKFYLMGIGFPSNSLIYNIAAAKTVQVLLNDETLYKYQAFFGRINYNWDKKYILNLTARRDGSSRFGPGNQFATFGAIGAAWLFSNEEYLKNSWLSLGKLRSSYGITGNDQIGDYQFLNTYTTSGAIYNGITGLKPTRLFNSDFGWETNKKFEIALETGFFNDRILFSAAYYQNTSSNQLVGIPLPGSTGFTVIQSNLDATVQNKGVEFTLSTLNFQVGSFSWKTNLNLTTTLNKLLSFPGLESSTYKQQYRIGQPLNIQLMYKFEGLNTQTGIYQFEDTNKDGVISSPNDKQTVVNFNPKFFGGIQNQVNYKGFSLDFLFQFVKQKNTSYPMGSGGMMSNLQERMLDSWLTPQQLGNYQQYTTGYNSDAVMGDYLFSQSTGSVVDASFIRLKNIAISYNLPLNLKDTKCRIILQGQNLLTFTKYEDGDPEFIAYGFLPPLKVITAGLQLTF